MRFVLLIRHDDTINQLDASQSKALTAECLAHDNALRARGKLVVANALQPPSHAKSVRYRRKTVFTDGPFAETKEQLIGLMVVEALDEAEALEIAAASPLARTGIIEVRGAYDIADG